MDTKTELNFRERMAIRSALRLYNDKCVEMLDAVELPTLKKHYKEEVDTIENLLSKIIL